ncbi:MAG: restriction endonuclease subunit S [Spirochaetes bacterium]|nr:restriction endonuclease subunit S [Spirochaetota bacterium]
MKYLKLSEIITIEKGKKNQVTDFPNEESVRLIQIDDLRADNNIRFTNEKNGARVNEDDLLIVWDGANAGTVGYGKKGYIGSTIAALKIYNKNFNTEFLGKYLQSKFNYLQSNSTGATIPHVNRKFLEDIKIPIIQIEDQIRIANLLSRIEELIAKRKESIRLLDEFVKSMFLEMFGDNNRNDFNYSTLDSLAEIVSGVTKGKSYNGQELIEIPYMRVANVKDGYIDLDAIKKINVTKSEVELYELKYGDILLTEGGDPDKLGRGAIWKEEIKLCIHQNHIFRVRITSDTINSIYLCYLIGSSYGKKYFSKAAKQTTGIASINSTQLKRFPVIIPPISMQNKLASLVGKVELMKIKYNDNLFELEKLYGSVSQRAFREGYEHFN